MKEERRQEKRGAGGKRWGEDEWGGARKLRADGAGGVGFRPRQEVGDRSLKVGRLRGLGRHLGSGGDQRAHSALPRWRATRVRRAIQEPSTAGTAASPRLPKAAVRATVRAAAALKNRRASFPQRP